jgi:hypothetical protein
VRRADTLTTFHAPIVLKSGSLRLLETSGLVQASIGIANLFISRSSLSQWPCSLRCSFVATRLLRLWVRIPPGAWMSVCCDYCVLSGRGLCDELITSPEESYRLLCVVMCVETT